MATNVYTWMLEPRMRPWHTSPGFYYLGTALWFQDPGMLITPPSVRATRQSQSRMMVASPHRRQSQQATSCLYQTDLHRIQLKK